MAVPTSLVLASEVIGFISFGFTLLTALGVYADLIKTLRGAPATIPIALGNLREELKYEQHLCAQNMNRPDKFRVTPRRRLGRRGRHDQARLLSDTLRHMWREFCDIERNFLVDGQKPWTGQDINDDGNHVDEKPSGNGRRRSGRPKPSNRQSFIKGRMGWVEAGLSRDRQTYYSTDLAHRFAWWWRKGDVDNLSQQLQRIQIRRIERDSYETNILVKRALKIYGHVSGADIYHSSDSGSDGGGGDSGSNSDDGGGPRGGYAHSRRHTDGHRSRMNGHRSSRNHSPSRRAFREVSEKEIVRRRAPSLEPRSPPQRPPSVVGSRRDGPRRGSIVYEYEIVDRGGIHIEYEDPRQDRARQEGRQRSFSRSQRPDGG